jgi:hypothetical protein
MSESNCPICFAPLEVRDVTALHNIGSFGYIVSGAHPKTVNFGNGSSRTDYPELAEQMFDHFKQWLVTANQEYRVGSSSQCDYCWRDSREDAQRLALGRVPGLPQAW